MVLYAQAQCARWQVVFFIISASILADNVKYVHVDVRLISQATAVQ